MNNTSKNYYGRRVDMSFYPPKIIGHPQTMGFGNQPAQVIAGPFKAAQNYVRVLLSSYGERNEDPEYGTDLLKEFSSGNMMLPIQINQTFSMNNLMALSYLKSKYTKLTPIDEKVSSVSLFNYTKRGSTAIDFELHLQTASRESLIFLLPVTF